MNSRRDFLKLATTSGLLVGLPVSNTLARSADPVTDQALSLLAYDDHNLEARNFVNSSHCRSIRKIAVGKDLTTLLQKEILPRLSDPQFRAAGITQGFPAYAMAEVVRDYGYAITYVSENWQHSLPNTSISNYPSHARDLSEQLSSPSKTIFWLLAPSGINFRA